MMTNQMVEATIAQATRQIIDGIDKLIAVAQAEHGVEKPAKRYTRWSDADDRLLVESANTLISAGLHGDRLAEQLAILLDRSVAGVAARLVKVGVWT